MKSIFSIAVDDVTVPGGKKTLEASVQMDGNPHQIAETLLTIMSQDPRIREMFMEVLNNAVAQFRPRVEFDSRVSKKAN